MEKITAILQNYSIFPQGIVNITDRLYQIKANGKQYALKRSKLKADKLENWKLVYHLAHQNGLQAILPIYLTDQKQLYVEMAGDIYYLSPWINERKRDYSIESIEKLFHNLGDIHLRTKHIQQINKEDLEKNFLPYKKQCGDDEKKLFRIIERIEKKHYPSPLELQVLTHYRDLSYSLKISQQLVDRIMSERETDASWGTSLIHGNLESGHCFEEYFINWENASVKHAIHDLSHFFQSETVNRYRNMELLIQAFPAYLEENPLNRLERALLSLYLLNMSTYLNALETYSADQRHRISTVEQTMDLEKMYRRIQFGLKFNVQLDTYTIPDDPKT